MTRLEQARDAGGRTIVWITPRAANARDAAAHYVVDARDWAGPRLGHGFTVARLRAQATTRERVLPALAAARLRMAAYGRDTVAPAVGPRAQHALDTAKQRMQDDVVPRAQNAAIAAKEAGEPVLTEARSRAEAAAMALRGDVSAAEMHKMVKKKQHKKRNSMFVLLMAMTIGATAGWLWWQRKAERAEWKSDEDMPMPPAGPDAYRSGDATVDMAVTDPGHAREDKKSAEDIPTTGGSKAKHRGK